MPALDNLVTDSVEQPANELPAAVAEALAILEELHNIDYSHEETSALSAELEAEIGIPLQVLHNESNIITLETEETTPPTAKICTFADLEPFIDRSNMELWLDEEEPDESIYTDLEELAQGPKEPIPLDEIEFFEDFRIYLMTIFIEL